MMSFGCCFSDFKSAVSTGVVSFALCFLSFSVKAQRDSIYKLQEVKVRGLPKPAVKSINPLQQVNAADFKRTSSYNVADAIRNFSGVNIKDYGGIGGLKTVSVRSLGANHTGVMLDGAPVSDAQNGQVDLGKINLDNVKSISLYNGQLSDIAVSAKSLSSASVLLVESIQPEFTVGKISKLNIGLKAGSFGLVNPSIQWQQKLGSRWTMQFANSLQKASGKYKYKVEGDGSDTLTTRTNANISALHSDLNLYWAATDSSQLRVKLNYTHSDRGLPGAVVFYNPYTNQHLWNRDFFTQVNYKQQWQRFRFVSAAKYAKSYLRYLDPDYLNIAGQLDQRYHQQEFYASGTLAYQMLPALSFAYASDAIHNTLNTNQYQYAYPVRYTYLNALSAALHLAKLKLQASLLHTYLHEKVALGKAAADRSVFTPSISASLNPFGGDAVMFRAFYKKIFRNPTFNDLYYTRMGNRSLKPEFATQYNLGATFNRQQLGILNYVTLTTDAYYNTVKDKIIAIPNKDLFTWTMLNLGEVDIRGIDIGFKTSAKTATHLNFLLGGNYTYQQALDVTDKQSSVYLNQIPYTPRHTLALNAGFELNDWSVFYNHIYSSHRYYLSENLPEYYVPGFSVSDLSLGKSFSIGQKNYSTSIEINNLFNQSYAFIRSYPMPGRSFRIAFQIKL